MKYYTLRIILIVYYFTLYYSKYISISRLHEIPRHIVSRKSSKFNYLNKVLSGNSNVNNNSTNTFHYFVLAIKQLFRKPGDLVVSEVVPKKTFVTTIRSYLTKTIDTLSYFYIKVIDCISSSIVNYVNTFFSWTLTHRRTFTIIGTTTFIALLG